MFILLLNQDWFAEELRALGHEVVTAGLNKSLDVHIPLPLVHIDTIIKDHLGGKVPDRIMIHDNSAPVCFVGLEERKIPTLFYSVDAHHHYDLHADLGKVFDHLLVAQKDYIKHMESGSDAPLEWMPLWASQYVEAEEQKEFGAVFVGSLNHKLNPDRVKFFEALDKKVPILYKTGAWWTIFPKAEIVINQTVKKDLNFRVFEAMMCGSLLVTEKTNNGLLDIFEDGKHLVTYIKGNVDEAAEKITYYLEHKDEAKKIARQGREEILKHHTIEHRARRVADLLERLEYRSHKPRKLFGWMSNCNGLTTRLNSLDTLLARQSNVHAVKAAEAALLAGEYLEEELTYILVYACCFFDRQNPGGAGLRLLLHAFERYPDRPVITLGIIRGLLNEGKVEEARRYAKLIDEENPERIFQGAEEVITALLEARHQDIGNTVNEIPR